jgi:hypothetical protein
MFIGIPETVVIFREISESGPAFIGAAIAGSPEEL